MAAIPAFFTDSVAIDIYFTNNYQFTKIYVVTEKLAVLPGVLE